MRGMGKDQGRTVALLSDRDLFEVGGNSERSERGRGKSKTWGGEEDARSARRCRHGNVLNLLDAF